MSVGHALQRSRSDFRGQTLWRQVIEQGKSNVLINLWNCETALHESLHVLIAMERLHGNSKEKLEEKNCTNNFNRTFYKMFLVFFYDLL